MFRCLSSQQYIGKTVQYRDVQLFTLTRRSDWNVTSSAESFFAGKEIARFFGHGMLCVAAVSLASDVER